MNILSGSQLAIVYYGRKYNLFSGDNDLITGPIMNDDGRFYNQSFERRESPRPCAGGLINCSTTSITVARPVKSHLATLPGSFDMERPSYANKGGRQTLSGHSITDRRTVRCRSLWEICCRPQWARLVSSGLFFIFLFSAWPWYRFRAEVVVNSVMIFRWLVLV